MREGRFESSLFISGFLCLDDLGILEMVQQKRQALLDLVGYVSESTNEGVEKGNVKEEEEQQYIRKNWPGVAYCQALHAWMTILNSCGRGGEVS